MLRPVLFAVSLAAFAAVSLETDYSIERTLVIESDSSLKLETTTMEVERDGEPVDSSRFGGGGASEQTRRWVAHDKTLAHDGTRPTKVRRAFQEIAGKRTFMAGEEERTIESDAPLKGVTLEIEMVGSDGGDKPVAKVVDGDTPGDAKALEGHSLTLALDALLPDEDVEVGKSWDLGQEQIRRALALDLEHALFPPPPPEEESSGGGGEGGRGRGRGSRGGGGSDVLARAEWEGKATLTDETEEQGGVACHVITVELKANGELPDPPQGERGGRGGRVAIDPASSELAVVFETKYELKLEGKLYFSRAEKRPVLLELEGTARLESNTERTFRESTTKMHSVRQGELKHRIAVSKAE